MPAAAPDFRLYHSNALDVLAGLLAHELRIPAPGQALLAPDTVLIPQVAMRRWLQATLAAAHGVAANLEFLTPGEFVARALTANLGPATDEPDVATLHWHLYAALTDAQFMAQPALAALRAHVDGPYRTHVDGSDPVRAHGERPDPQRTRVEGPHPLREHGDSHDPLRAWALAGELASVFEKYQAWRREWLLRWEAGAEPDDPQAILWRRIARGRSHRARRIQQYLDRFEARDAPLPTGLPPRLFAFATLNVSPDVLRVLATQARVGTLHFYVPSPSRDYWGDLQRVRAGGIEAAHDDAARSENPLLQAWGHAGRDFMAVLGGYEVVHASAEIAAHADPGEKTGSESIFPPDSADPDNGRGKIDSDPVFSSSPSLLRRLQADLFHRRPSPPLAPTATDPRTRLPALRRDDPSLQLHACHTRLRELQVLRDQLRALFDDERFDPPLKPREVAVLAPDVDPYLPYLEAVFGDRGREDAIPYALADASPLANEPLAEVFVRLLALPVSRFGLHETLDLLASPALAEANGLDAPAIERLQAWLLAAGARWGLDGEHRARFDAPEDDAYTWAFALDRLLLGHASGSEALIRASDGRILAPLPDLEGSALDALDTLVRLLRVLARNARVLGAAMPPAQWRERLLELLDALLPRPPSNPASQRALDRLRTLVDGFASTAGSAGFEDPVPAEAVRAHFRAVLAEADTRAPLLTGGVSIARMVPMRLLPFRVICVLGMNDAEFPRRDPAAGLNRLTAELGTDRRRAGDRSTRDDDRFLFLQLFTAAQDVFYASWQGADPRDGSRREPSVLVSELIDAAVDQHAAGAQDVADALVVRHPLQPFSAEAFGSEAEPRRFSYHARWQQAAAGAADRRQPLPPWFAGEPFAPGEAEPELPISALRRFLLHPAEELLARMGMRLVEIEEQGADLEPLAAPGAGLERSVLQRALFNELLRGLDDPVIHASLRARGLLPSGAAGRRVLVDQRELLAPWLEAFSQWRGDAEAGSVLAEVEIDGVRVHGRIQDVYPHGIPRLRFGKPNGPSAVRSGLDWLLARAAGIDLPLVEFFDGGRAGPGPFERPELSPADARNALRELLALRAHGLRAPLPYAPYSAWAYYDCAGNPERGVKAARSQWHGSGGGFAEGHGDALRQALRGCDPFGDQDSLQRFVDAAMLVFLALQDGKVHGGTDPATLDGLAERFEPEDAE
ncbi:exodeoxyribonuclease V subunit gamma [Luteimonas sp. SJ-92]|uniref:RecBCD enzyme subunit RecC n=1 Tax=Luteimonas salinisoli TaxID=2752307 RepID=A0A853JH09_9GAMM|nr:exodeoxyribonuclease V subunit gamma [Luteimonas salinisoli]NZA27740.1 exodeoxyribonuclease V subunit gamma [Luteimonas salinisoli]